MTRLSQFGAERDLAFSRVPEVQPPEDYFKYLEQRGPKIPSYNFPLRRTALKVPVQNGEIINASVHYATLQRVDIAAVVIGVTSTRQMNLVRYAVSSVLITC